jgi:hypothetical protein
MLGSYGILRRKRETMHLSASVFRTWADSVLLFQRIRQGPYQSQRVSYLGCVRFLDQGHPCRGTQYFRDKDLQPSMRSILSGKSAYDLRTDDTAYISRELDLINRESAVGWSPDQSAGF